ncbi:hypothetical protein Vadar_009477 [Vaccinium darrowii]|uniref:Uncharacterized protein n=1 Tax=Vaccinium darrowii TaxID=229202 RepID=A0ACB7ZJG6_9ERIC|nr:hypothetical protein Vadar_009477 [Vaccinium darrowii]
MEEASVSKPHTDEERKQELGLGFQSSPSTGPGSNLEHRLAPPDNDLDQQILEKFSGEIRVLVLEENERESEKETGKDDNVITKSENGSDCNRGKESVPKEAAVAVAVAPLKDGRHRIYHYPVRPDAEDCAHYMRTGTCKFGKNCKYNHQIRRKYQPAKDNMREKEENTERPGQPAKENMGEKEENAERPRLVQCKYYLSSGGCIFGKACKYHHGRGKAPVAPIMEFNFLGLPIRPGEKDCPYYMSNGSCKYESNCWFNHPDPTTVGGGDTPSVFGDGGSGPSPGAIESTAFSWSPPRTVNENVPFVPAAFSPTHNVHAPNVEWNGYQAPAYPAPMPPAIAVNNSAETNFFAHHNLPKLIDEFPERPGQPACTYFLKTGNCKYRSACKFHHPKFRIHKTPAFAMSEKGLPLRPDQNVCSHYYHYGICKFGPGCKYDHPVKYAKSVSSIASGPGMPYHFGQSAT